MPDTPASVLRPVLSPAAPAAPAPSAAARAENRRIGRDPAPTLLGPAPSPWSRGWWIAPMLLAGLGLWAGALYALFRLLP